MSPIRFNLVLLFGIVAVLTLNRVECNRDIPGAIELVGYNSRKARMSGESFDESTSPVQLPSEKEKADIETVKKNIDAYNRLLKADTKKLSSQQKDMLEKIVERVARLKAVLDVDATKNQTKDSADIETTTFDMDKPTTPVSPDPPTTATEIAVDEITTTLLPDTTEKPDQTEARANNKLDASIGKSHSESKYKIRQTTTPKSASQTKPTTKRNIVHNRTTQKHSASSVSSGSNNGPSSANPTHGNTMVTGTPMQQLKQHVNLRNSQPSAVQETSTAKQLNSEIAEESTNAVNVGGSLAPDLSYDSTNETASSIIDSLANHAREDYYTKGSLIDSNNNGNSNSKMKQKPTATAKPTKYHYYPHNQHIYLLPECAIQQVCNAVYVRLNYTQPLCACPSRYRDPCSASLNEDDQHTTKLIGNSKKKAITLAKTCEATTEMRECRTPKDWSLLALQNTRTGKSHYLVICRCPDHYKLEGPMAHDQPTYASVPGIRVFGMMCVRPGYSVRKPSVQPPKRYQLQKPFYMTTSNQYGSNKDTRPSYQDNNQYGANKDTRPSYQDNNQYGSNKDTRPSYQDNSYQSQHQANYQYLNRPETSSIINISNAQDFVDSISLNNFDGIYGRNNEKKEETTAAETTTPLVVVATTKREKRSVETDDDPPFPWDKVVDLQNSILWG